MKDKIDLIEEIINLGLPDDVKKDFKDQLSDKLKFFSDKKYQSILKEFKSKIPEYCNYIIDDEMESWFESYFNDIELQNKLRKVTNVDLIHNKDLLSVLTEIYFIGYIEGAHRQSRIDTQLLRSPILDRKPI